MRKRLPFIILYAAVAIILGAASAWPVTDVAALAHAVANAAFLFAGLAAFLVILPQRFSLPVQIFIAMVAGIAVGWILTPWDAPLVTDYLGVFGQLFVLLLKLVITPLIFVSIVCGVAGIGDVRKLGSLGAKTIGFYLMTTAAAVLIGLACVNIVQPGAGRAHLRDQVQEEQQTEERTNLGVILQDEALPRLIQNPIMAGQDVIAIIFFALLFGAALASIGPPAEAAIATFRGLDRALITIILWIMALAPIGVFALMAGAISELGLQYVYTLAKYCFTVFLGLGLHFCLLCLVIVPVLGRVSPMRFLRGMLPAFEVAFSTSSSSATIPVTMECASKRVGADENICSFMLPIGATINMDGTALYVSVASLFVAQVYGVDLSIQQQLMVFLTAVMVSIGTAGIPGASIGLMAIILSSVGLPPEGVGIVIGVDRILDMTRTVVNITGDSVGAVVISRSEGRMTDPASSTAS